MGRFIFIGLLFLIWSTCMVIFGVGEMYRRGSEVFFLVCVFVCIFIFFIVFKILILFGMG